MKKRDFILAIGALAFLLLVIFISLLLGDRFQVQNCGCPKLVSRNFIYIFIILAAVFIASLVYYLTSFKIETQKKIMDKNIGLILGFLDKDEKEIIEKLIENKGEIMQNELTRQHGKLKSHRVIQRLKNKKIIDIKKAGRTNLIKLKSELKKELI